MTVQWSTTVRNARLDAIETAIGTSPKLQFWSGAQPATCATAASGTKLAEFTLASDWSPNASGGSKSITLPSSVTGLATNTAGYYRFVDSAGTTCHEQGSISVTGGGGDLTLDNTSISTGQTVNLTGFTKTEAGA